MAQKFQFNAQSEEALALATKVANSSSLQESVEKMKNSHLSAELQNGDVLSFPAGLSVVATFDAEVKDDNGNVVIDKITKKAKTEPKDYFALKASLVRDVKSPKDFRASVNAFLREEFATILRDEDGNEVDLADITDSETGQINTDGLYLYKSDLRSRFGEAKICYGDSIVDGKSSSYPYLEEEVQLTIVKVTVFVPIYKKGTFDKDHKRWNAFEVKQMAIADLN